MAYSLLRLITSSCRNCILNVYTHATHMKLHTHCIALIVLHFLLPDNSTINVWKDVTSIQREAVIKLAEVYILTTIIKSYYHTLMIDMHVSVYSVLNAIKASTLFLLYCITSTRYTMSCVCHSVYTVRCFQIFTHLMSMR